MSDTGRSRKSRRVVRPAAPGADPKPAEHESTLAAEDDPKRWGDAPQRDATEDDDRLRREKPPHWG